MGKKEIKKCKKKKRECLSIFKTCLEEFKSTVGISKIQSVLKSQKWCPISSNIHTNPQWWFSRWVMSNSYDPVDCSLSGSTAHGKNRKNSPGKNTRVGAISFFRGSSWPRNQSQASCIAGRFFTNLSYRGIPAEPPGKPKNTGVGSLSLLQWIFPTQELNQGLLLCSQALY